MNGDSQGIAGQEVMREEYQKRFMAFLIHDINNHIHIVNGHILLAKLQADTGDIADRLASAETGLQQVEYLIQLLCGRHEEEKQTLALAPFLHAVTKFVLGSAKKIEHRVIETGDLWPVCFRCNLLLRILANLLTNALEAMPDGGMITITLENYHVPKGEEYPQGGYYVKAAIQDQGTGIPGDILPRIFVPGFSTKENGSGLGLAFCRSILEKNGGRLEVISTAGAGSVFTLYLPAVVPS